MVFTGSLLSFSGTGDRSHGLSGMATSTVCSLLTFAYFPLAPAQGFPSSLSQLALKGSGWLFQMSLVYTISTLLFNVLKYNSSRVPDASEFYTPSIIGGLRKVSLEQPRGPFSLKGFI